MPAVQYELKNFEKTEGSTNCHREFTSKSLKKPHRWHTFYLQLQPRALYFPQTSSKASYPAYPILSLALAFTPAAVNDRNGLHSCTGGMDDHTEYWQLYYDEQGQPYYYNEATMESRWDDPRGVEAEEGAQGDGFGVAEEASGQYEGGEGHYDEEGFGGEPVDYAGDGVVDDTNVANYVNAEEDVNNESNVDYTINTDAAIYDNGNSDTFDETLADTNDDIAYLPLNNTTNNNYTNNLSASPATKEIDTNDALEELGWVKYTTSGGSDYYYNLETQETQWTTPDEVLQLSNTKQLSRPNSALSNSLGYGAGVNSGGNSNNVITANNSSGGGGKFTAVGVSGATPSSLSPSRSLSSSPRATSPKGVSFSPIPNFEQGTLKASDLTAYERVGEDVNRSKFSPILLDKIRKRFRAASYATSGMDWEAVFKRFDKSGDNVLDVAEFKNAIRKGLGIQPRDISDRDVDVLVQELDMNGDGGIDLIEFGSFLHGDERENIDDKNIALKRSIRGLKPRQSKSDFNAHEMGTWELSDGNYGRAKKAMEEIEMQKRARQIAEQNIQRNSSEAAKRSLMAEKIKNVKPVRERLKKRFSPRGRRRGDTGWDEKGYRLKVAHSARNLWRDKEVRQAAYAALLKDLNGDLVGLMGRAREVHKRNKRSKVTPFILEDIRKKIKADSYTPRGENLVKLFNKYDDTRTGYIDFQRFKQIIRKNCKYGKGKLSDYDVLEIFETIAGRGDSSESIGVEIVDGKGKKVMTAPDLVVDSESDGINLEHFLRFIKTDVPAALSLTNAAGDNVTTGEVMMYVIDKNKKRLRDASVEMGIKEWDEVFKLYDSDGNGVLTFDEFLRIFRVDLRLSEKEMKEEEAKFIFRYIDTDGSGGISADEFMRFLHSGRQERSFPRAEKEEETGGGRRGAGEEFDAHLDFERREENKKQSFIAEMTDVVKQKFRSYSYGNTSGQDFEMLFKQVDKGADGVITEKEFRMAVRKLLKVGLLMMSDKDLLRVFNSIATEVNGNLGLDKSTFINFIKDGNPSGDGEDRGGGAQAWVHRDEEAIARENLKRIRAKINMNAMKFGGEKDIKRVFNSMDCDGGGTISLNELCDGLRNVLRISEREIGRSDCVQLFRKLDVNSDGVLSLDEFVSFLAKDGDV